MAGRGRAREHGSRSHRARGDAGETLIEVVATVAVMGIAAVAMLFAIGAAIELSTTHRNQADADVALGVAAEAVKAFDPAACPVDTATYAPALAGLALPDGWSPSDLAIVDPTGCDSLQLQTITIEATAPGDGSSATVAVVKRGQSS